MYLLITNIIQDTVPSWWARTHNFNKETKHPSITSSYIVCNSYIINSSFVHREMVIHTPAWSSAKVSPVMQWISPLPHLFPLQQPHSTSFRWTRAPETLSKIPQTPYSRFPLMWTCTHNSGQWHICLDSLITCIEPVYNPPKHHQTHQLYSSTHVVRPFHSQCMVRWPHV